MTGRTAKKEEYHLQEVTGSKSNYDSTRDNRTTT